MYEINNEKFGAFLSQLRKEHGMTQKDLAEKLFVSDKAVSKWERGLSLPDIALLQPIADTLDVTVTELLAGEYIRNDQELTVRDVEAIVQKSIHLVAQEQAGQQDRRRWWKWVFAVACVCAVAEVLALLLAAKFVPIGNVSMDDAAVLWLPPFLAFIFGLHFIFFAKERLPAFYDDNRINFYSSGAFRMNLMGLRFNNSNWPHILRVIRVWCVGTLAGWPALSWLLQATLEQVLPGQAGALVLRLALLAAMLGGLLVPVYIIGRKYE